MVVRNIILSTFILLFGCTNNFYKSSGFKTDCNLIIIIQDKNINPIQPFEFFIKNLSSYDLNLSHPTCVNNTTIKVFDKSNNEKAHLMLYRAIRNCDTNYISIRKDSVVSIKMNYSLQQMFGLLPGNEYKISIVSKGKIKIGERYYSCPDIIYKGGVFIR